jgi:tRNA 2-thiouridine synthesizing protein E
LEGEFIMLDINKALSNARLDPEGNMFDLDSWSPKFAQRQATTEEIDFLTEEHWEIIYFLRERYRNSGAAASGREVLKELEEKFADGHGSRHLYELFPRGPVSQASRLAGLPMPPHSIDTSFGSVL